MTTDRFIHLVVGLAFGAAAVYWFRKRISISEYIRIYIFAALGTWVPDWDLVLGIGFHRSPFTHSIFPWMLLMLVIKKYKLSPFLSIGFAIGLASHLVWDTLFYGDVRMISGGGNE